MKSPGIPKCSGLPAIEFFKDKFVESMGSLLFGMTGLKKAHVKTSEASFLTKVILPELRVQSLRSKFMVQSQTALGCGLSTASKSKRSRLAKGDDSGLLLSPWLLPGGFIIRQVPHSMAFAGRPSSY